MVKQKVLIVDDEPINRFIIKVHLSQTDVEVVEAQNGKEALNLLNMHTDVSLILLDLNMPVLDGYGFLNSLNNSFQYAHRPLSVVIVSSIAEKNFLSAAEKKGVDTSRIIGYMRKPIQVETLLKLVSQVPGTYSVEMKIA